MQNDVAHNPFIVRCKGVAIVLAALSGLILGILNWFKEVRDPRAKVGYQELAKQVENLSLDLKKTADTFKQQGEEIATVQNWIIYERDRRGTPLSAAVIKIQKQTKVRPKSAPPPVRTPKRWENLRVPPGPTGY